MCHPRYKNCGGHIRTRIDISAHRVFFTSREGIRVKPTSEVSAAAAAAAGLAIVELNVTFVTLVFPYGTIALYNLMHLYVYQLKNVVIFFPKI